MNTVNICRTENGTVSPPTPAVVLAEKLAAFYARGRFVCWYFARVVRTSDGRLWTNRPRRPEYPEEFSDSAVWHPAAQ